MSRENGNSSQAFAGHLLVLVLGLVLFREMKRS